MISKKLKKIKHLEEHVILKLKLLKLQDDFKSLVSIVAHDITTPLGYLKFSTEILNSQLDEKADKNLKETARVITNSTSKLNKEAIQIIDDARSKLEKQKEFWPAKDVIVSSFENFDIDFDKNLISGQLKAELKTDFILNKYLISSILICFYKLKMKIDSVVIESKEEKLLIRFNSSIDKAETYKLVESEIKGLKQKEVLNSVCDYLDAEISLKEEKTDLTLSLNLAN